MYNADWIWPCCIGFVPCGSFPALILTVAFVRRSETTLNSVQARCEWFGESLMGQPHCSHEHWKQHCGVAKRFRPNFAAESKSEDVFHQEIRLCIGSFPEVFKVESQRTLTTLIQRFWWSQRNYHFFFWWSRWVTMFWQTYWIFSIHCASSYSSFFVALFSYLHVSLAVSHCCIVL